MYYSAKDSDEEITILELHNAGYLINILSSKSKKRRLRCGIKIRKPV